MKSSSFVFKALVCLLSITSSWDAHAVRGNPSVWKRFKLVGQEDKISGHKRTASVDIETLADWDSFDRNRSDAQKKHKSNSFESLPINEFEQLVQSPMSLMDLPDEISTMIFYYLPKETLLNMRLVCRRLKEVASDTKLYEQFFVKGWSGPQLWFAFPHLDTFERFLFNRMMFSTLCDFLLYDFSSPEKPVYQRFFKSMGRLTMFENKLDSSESEKREVLNFMRETLIACFHNKAHDNDRKLCPPRPLSCLDIDIVGQNKLMRDFYNIALYIANRGEEIPFFNYDPQAPSVLERFLRIEDIRSRLTNREEPDKMSLCERLLQLSIRPLSDTEDLRRAANIYFNNATYSRAAELYDEALRRNQNHPAVCYSRAAYAHLRSNNYPRAAELYDEALSRDPNRPAVAYKNAADAHFKNNNYPRAAELYDEALSRDPNLCSGTYTNAGIAHHNNNNFPRAAELFDEILRRDPNRPAVMYINAAFFHLRSNNYPRAVELYDEALRRDPNLPAVCYSHAGLAHLRNNNYPRAAALYDEVIRRDPNHPAVCYSHAGLAHLRNNNYPRAAELYDEALRRDPNLPAVCYSHAGLAHLRNNNYPRAAELYDEALRRDPNLPAVCYSHAGLAHLRNNNYPRAAELYDEALRRNQNHPAVCYSDAGLAHFKNNNYPRAVELYDEALSRDPNRPAVAYKNAADAHFKNNNYPRAVELYDEALSRDPNPHASAYAKVGIANLFNGNLSRTRTLLSKYLSEEEKAILLPLLDGNDKNIVLQKIETFRLNAENSLDRQSPLARVIYVISYYHHLMEGNEGLATEMKEKLQQMDIS